MAKTYDDWYNEIKKKNDALAQEKINRFNEAADNNTAAYAKKNAEDISTVKADYETEYDLNEIQRIINEKELEAKMADMGLQKSGINATNRTALQLGYSKAKAQISLQERKAITSLKQQLSSYIANAEKEKAENELKVKEQYDRETENEAAELYSNEVKANAAASKGSANSGKSGESKADKNKSTAISTIKRDFSKIYNQYAGLYTKENTAMMFSAVLELEKEHNISAFECMSILSCAKLKYDDYCSWKKTGKVKGGYTNDNNVLITPWFLR